MKVLVQWVRGTDYLTVKQENTEKILWINSPVGVEQNDITRGPSLKNSTKMGYAYSVSYRNHNSWPLSCPKYSNKRDIVFSFMCAERESYANRLDNFRKDVDHIAAIEQKIEARTSAKILNAAFAVAFAATGTPEGFAVAFTAWFADRDYSVQIQDLAADLGVYQNDAYDNYWRIHKEWTDLARVSPELSMW